MRTSLGSILTLIAISLAVDLRADEPIDFGHFEKNVRPVFIKHCFGCHRGEAAESGLQIDSRAGLLRGGLRGPAIIPGNPKESLLIRALSHGEQLQMPPKKKLSLKMIQDIAAWVKSGAAWPNSPDITSPAGSDPAASNQRTSGAATNQSDIWAFRPPAKPQLPPVKRSDWIQSPLDTFILAQLEEHAIAAAPAASKYELIRRASFDLIGLPPSYEQVQQFLKDSSPLAFERVVDRLLSSPRYGERWGRHWLDTARYADSNGLDENLAYGNAFHYRDYVVRAFNSDKPYNRFVREQIAGDLLDHDGTDDQTVDTQVATAFLSLGAKMLAEDDPMKMQMDIIDEQVDTIGRAFIGLTLGCARCHDHKFDPISTRDYYALAGIFKSTKTMENFKVVARWQERPIANEQQLAQTANLQSRIGEKAAEINKLTSGEIAAAVGEARLRSASYFLAAMEQLLLQQALSGTLSGTGPLQGIGARPPVVVEAETVQRGNLVAVHDGYGKGIGVIAGPGGKNEGEFDLTIAPGTYQIAFRYAAAESRPTRLIINGKLINESTAGDVTGSWFPDTQAWKLEGRWENHQATAVVRLERDGPIPHVDKIAFVPADSLRLGHNRRPPLHPMLVSQWVGYLNGQQKTPDSFFREPLGLLRFDPNSNGGDTGNNRPTRSIALKAFAEKMQNRVEAIYGKQCPAQLSDFDASLKKALEDPKGPFATPESPETLFSKKAQTALAELNREKKQLEQSLPELPSTMAVSDYERPEDLRIHIRGSHTTLGSKVHRGFPAALSAGSHTISHGSGRLQLSNWLSSASHPLTARVMANRIWKWHFGYGIVRSPDNFGTLGQRPTHPELLDWLAVRFAESGWSIKSIHRTLVLSSTYQMSAAWNPVAAELDPENKLYWRANRRRLEAEALRDSLLWVSGELDSRMGGSNLPTKNRSYVTSTANVDPVAYKTTKRSVYLPIVRSAVYDVFQAFDFPDPAVSNGRRQTSTVAPQALFMMNSEFVSQRTKAVAATIEAMGLGGDRERVEQLYRLVYARGPSEFETAAALEYVSRYHQLADGSETVNALAVWQSLGRILVAANEFLYVE